MNYQGMTTRRSLLALSAAVKGFAPVLGAQGRARAGCQTNAWMIDATRFSSLLDVLAKIRELGFVGFETGFRNLESQFSDPKSARNSIRKSGLRFLGSHIFLNQYDPATCVAPWDLIERVAKGSGALGAERLVLSGAPARDAAGKLDKELLKAKAAALNRAAKFCHELAMMRVAYHNHGPEFAAKGEELEGLMRLTDPAQVRFIVDCGHAIRAKADVAAFFEKHSTRIDGLHLRDFRNNVQVPFGQGDYDYRPLAMRIKEIRYQGWLIAEEERESGEKPGALAAAPAREAIRKLFQV